MTGSPGLRLLFESLGEDTGFWNMSPTGKDSVDALGVDLGSLFLNNYETDKELRRDVGRFFDEVAINKDEPSFSNGNIGNLELIPKKGIHACDSYKELVRKLNEATSQDPTIKSKAVN